MPLGQSVCGTEGYFIPLAGPVGRKMGKTHQFIISTRVNSAMSQGIAHLGRDKCFSPAPDFSPAPRHHASSVVPLAEAERPSGTSLAREKLNFSIPMQLLRNGGRVDVGQPSLPHLEPPGQWARTEAGRAARGSLPPHLPRHRATDASLLPGVLAEQEEILLQAPARCSFTLLSRRSLCTLQKLAVPCS